MKTNSILLFVVITLISPVLNAQQDGWKSLFNGRDLSGWQVCAKPKDAAKQYWKVQDSSIIANTNGDKDHDHLWLATTQEFQDFW